MHIQESDRKEVVDSLAYRSQIKDLILNRFDLGPFEQYFRSPDMFYSQGYPEKCGDWPAFENKKLLPLWRHEECLFAFDFRNNEIFSFYVEIPAEYKVYQSVDHAIFEMILLHVWEYGGGKLEAEQAFEFAVKIGLPDLSSLSELLKNHMECTEEEIESYISRLQ